MVQGHVDGTGVIKEFRKEKDSLWVTVGASPEIMQYIAEKGKATISTAVSCHDLFCFAHSTSHRHGHRLYHRRRC